jgi:hypothetical protein
MNEIERHRSILEARASRLAAEAERWGPADMADRRELVRRQDEQKSLLWDMALTGGGIILRLAVLRLLNSRPRLQTRALQTRADIGRQLDEGTLPDDLHPVRGVGFDVLVVKLFDECCWMWLGRDTFTGWYGHEVEVAIKYARFMRELAEHLREAHGLGTG